jgi:mitochondrial distribution and morphology protein 12
MSVDIEWDTITAGADGEALAEKIREFIHDKFQQIRLPRFINSVQVHSFDFGSICPEIKIKDVCDPLPDFYEDDESDDRLSSDPKDNRTLHSRSHEPSTHINQDRLQRLQDQIMHGQVPSDAARGPRTGLRQNPLQAPYHPDHLAGLFPRSGTPGIPGGTSNIGYFNLPLGGLSGTQTPLAAVASGTPFTSAGWNHDGHGSSAHALASLAAAFSPIQEGVRQRQQSVSPTRPSTANTIPSQPSPFNPGSPQSQPNMFHPAEKVSDIPEIDGPSSPLSPRMPPPSQPDDLQVVAHVTYAGDIKLYVPLYPPHRCLSNQDWSDLSWRVMRHAVPSVFCHLLINTCSALTAEILLDYPMPSFVGIPLQLNITGLTFDGVAIVAYIRKRMHFCFLSPEDAETLTSDIFNAESPSTPIKAALPKQAGSMGGLLQEIKVESEIGRKGEGKQSLKNVGKVEKFVLEQVRRIFEEEFVFPSFWTFLV